MTKTYFLFASEGLSEIAELVSRRRLPDKAQTVRPAAAAEAPIRNLLRSGFKLNTLFGWMDQVACLVGRLRIAMTDTPIAMMAMTTPIEPTIRPVWSDDVD